MLLLYETAGGHALFELKSSEKLGKSEKSELVSVFGDRESVAKKVKLKAFSAFKDTTEAVSAATDFVESKLGKPLKKFLTKNVNSSELGVADAKLAAVIKEKLGISVVHNVLVNEAIRGVRLLCDRPMEEDNLEMKFSPLPSSGKEVRAMQLGLSHTLSRYKLKFSPDKVDTMVVQAVGLLDDLDKEINTYAMRVREWYGWHFPELASLLNDNLKYARTVLTIGMRSACKQVSLDLLAEALADKEVGPDEILAQQVKDLAEMSMGTEVDESDMNHVRSLAEQVVELTKYRARLAQYLSARMQAIAPNLTVLVGDLVGARLVQHAGSILNLAKHPASTIQILGAEKALFRALKTKHDTPKYGLIYHASLVGQAAPKNKGKISRVLAAKCALAVRLDALAEDDDITSAANNDLGLQLRAKVEMRLRQLEGGEIASTTTPAVKRKLIHVLSSTTTAAKPYSEASDFTLGTTPNGDEQPAKKKKKKKSTADDDDNDDELDDSAAEKKKKKKRKAEEDDLEATAASSPAAADDSASKKKKKKKKSSD